MYVWVKAVQIDTMALCFSIQSQQVYTNIFFRLIRVFKTRLHTELHTETKDTHTHTPDIKVSSNDARKINVNVCTTCLIRPHTHSYRSWGVTSLGGFFRYCLKRSSKAWPMVLMTSWAKPSEHSRIWHATMQEIIIKYHILQYQIL